MEIERLDFQADGVVMETWRIQNNSLIVFDPFYMMEPVNGLIMES